MGFDHLDYLSAQSQRRVCANQLVTQMACVIEASSARRARGTLTSAADLKDAIHAYLDGHNTATPSRSCGPTPPHIG
jgi:hypothetical protein